MTTTSDLLLSLPGVSRPASSRFSFSKYDDATFIGYSKAGNGIYHLHKADYTDSEKRLLRLIGKEEIILRRVIEQAIASAKLAAGDLNTIARLITEGRLFDAVDRASTAAGIRVAEGYAATYVLAGQETAKNLENFLDVVIGFDQVNWRAVNHMQNRRLNLIREFTEEQRTTAQVVMRDGIARGLNPRDQARQFRESVGLTGRQENAVQNYRRALEGAAESETAALTRQLRDRRFDRTVQRAARTGKPLTTSQINRMTSRYRQRYIKYRAEVIARTEALRSVHAGTEELYRQAIDAGHVQEQELERTWVAAADERTRASHQNLNGMKRGINETFPGQDGELKYPGDPDAPASETIQCRCSLATRIRNPNA